MIFRFLSAVSSKDLPRLQALDQHMREFYGSAIEQGFWTCVEEQNTDRRYTGIDWSERQVAADDLASRGCEIESPASPPGTDAVFGIARKRSR